MGTSLIKELKKKRAEYITTYNIELVGETDMKLMNQIINDLNDHTY